MKALLLGIVLVLGAEVGFRQPPLGLDIYMPVPDANPLTREKVVLGRRLFLDKRLSGAGRGTNRFSTGLEGRRPS